MNSKLGNSILSVVRFLSFDTYVEIMWDNALVTENNEVFKGKVS